MPYFKSETPQESITTVLLEQLGIWKENNLFTKVKDKCIGVIFHICFYV